MNLSRPASEVRGVAKLAFAGIAVVGATALSLFTSEFGALSARLAMLIILGLAYTKARLVLSYFVEIQRGSWQWRAFLELWLLGAVGGIAMFGLA